MSNRYIKSLYILETHLIIIVHVYLLKIDAKTADVVRTSLRESAAVSGLIWTTVGT